MELCALSEEDLGLYPSLASDGLTDGTMVHPTISYVEKGPLYTLLELPEKYQEDAGRGTEINLRMDQLRVVDYWAQAGQTALIGVALQVNNHTVEYWMQMSLDPAADEPLETYRTNSQVQWQAKIREMSPYIAQCFDDAPMKFRFRMRCQGNTLKIWSTPEELAETGSDKPLAEAPIAKDIW
jgi:hypothetical protein